MRWPFNGSPRVVKSSGRSPDTTELRGSLFSSTVVHKHPRTTRLKLPLTAPDYARDWDGGKKQKGDAPPWGPRRAIVAYPSAALAR
jgi:hypothetical protein